MYALIKNNWPWFVLAIIFLLLHSEHQLNSDEGLILNAAWNIINGRVLYFETFEFIPPLAPYLVAAWWRITEISFLSAAALAWLISFSSAIALYLLSLRIGIKHWRFLAPSLFILSSIFWPLINHNAFSLAAVLWAVYLALGERSKKSTYIVSGLMAGVAALFLQHKGAVVIFGLALWFIYNIYLKNVKLRDLLYFIGAAIMPLLGLLIFWPARLLYENLINFPLNQYPETNMVSLTLLLVCAGIGLAGISLGFLQTDTKTQNKRIALLIIGLGLLMSCWPRADAAHVLAALAPFFVLIAYSFELYLDKKYDQAAFSILWLACVLFVLPFPLFKSRTAESFVAEINKTCPTKKIYAGPFMPGLYFEARTLSPLPYSLLITRQQSEEQFDQAAHLLEKNPPDCVLLDYEIVEKFDYNMKNPVDAFFKSQYRFFKKMGSVEFYLKQ